MSAMEDEGASLGAPAGNNNAVGNAGGGAPVGNSNAVGNQGGSAPEKNTNRKSHGVYCDLDQIDERAEGEVANFIDELEIAIRERADEDVGEIAREIPLRLIRHARATQYIQSKGLFLNDGKLNPMIPKARRMLDRILDDLGELSQKSGEDSEWR